jgi:hypothetical protein
VIVKPDNHMQPSVPAEFTCLVYGAMQPFDLGLLAVVNTILGGWPPGNWPQAAICEITPVKSPSLKDRERQTRMDAPTALGEMPVNIEVGMPTCRS